MARAENFLHSLVTNAIQHEYRPYWDLVALSLTVIQQLGVVAFAAIATVEIATGTVAASLVRLFAFFLLATGSTAAFILNASSLTYWTVLRPIWQTVMLTIG